MKFTENCRERIASEAAELMEKIEKLSALELSSLNAEETMAVFVDIINGFIREGAMASERVADIINPNAELMKKCNERKILTCAFADCHKENAAEFQSFPPHCIEGTAESRLVEELTAVGGYVLIPKNSTNGFHEEAFRKILDENKNINTFIVTGDCTDICVMQFCLALKTYFTKADKNVRIIVPVSCVETYDAPYHSSDFANLAAFKLMSDSGVEFVKSFS